MSMVGDIGNVVIWGWLILAPLFVMVVDAIHRIDKTLRHNYCRHNNGSGLRFWRGWWFDFAHDDLHYLVALLWGACIFGVGLTYGNVHEKWDIVPWFLNLVDQLAEPIGWLCLLGLPFPIWLISIKLSVYLIVKWSKK